MLHIKYQGSRPYGFRQEDFLCFSLYNIVSMIRRYDNHKLQTNPWHREEEPHNNHETPRGQTKQSNQLSLPHRDDCKTRMAQSNAQQNIEHRIPQWE